MEDINPDEIKAEVRKLRNRIEDIQDNWKHDAGEDMVKEAEKIRSLAKRVDIMEIWLERRRIEEVARIEENLHPRVLEECPICREKRNGDPIVCYRCGESICDSCFQNYRKLCAFCRYDNSTLRGDEEFVNALLKLAKERKNAWAMCRLSWIYHFGLCGITVDNKEALKWCYESVNLGYVDAMHFLSQLLEEEDKGNTSESRKWLTEAVNGGSAHAQVRLGVKLYTGEGGDVDLVGAARCFSLAVSHEFEIHPWLRDKCHLFLAKLFYDGKGGLNESLELTKHYVSKISSSKDGEADLLLGNVLYELDLEHYPEIGIPGHNSIPRVLSLFRQALAKGNPDARFHIEDVENDASRCCNRCKKEAEGLQIQQLTKCEVCKAVWYCGVACQNEDWEKGHKVDCCESL